ncbi:MAG: hypothetical protein HY695_27720 [Deltaproteobacteria bacterium]|nr:hypothetical protein [Deltaproteobacteria bacterium]
MLNRSALLSLALLSTNIFVGVRIYRIWQDGPWELPLPSQAKTQTASEERAVETKKLSERTPQPLQLASTKAIIEKNLFDPQRHTVESTEKQREAEALAKAAQRIRSMVLLGTAILGENRYAIVEDGADSRAAGPRPQTGQPVQIRRLKLGEMVDGFKISEIDERKVVFTKGTSTVDLALDYFRKFDQTKTGVSASAPAGPQVRASSAASVPGATQPGTPLMPRYPRRDMRN